MCELLKLFSSIDNIISELDILLIDAQNSSQLENLSANKIQRLYRGYVARKKIYYKNLAANIIERVFRGHSGRLFFQKINQMKQQRRRLATFTYFALQLQKCFRGFYSRKYRQNHASRKRYLQHVVLVGQEVRESMKIYAQKQIENNEKEAALKKEKEFKQLTENLHHLVSTKQIHGVYQPPSYLLEPPTVNNIPVEEYLRGAVKDLLKAKGIKKTGLVKDLNGTLKVPNKGVKHRLSLQASVPYDVLEKERLRQKILHEILTRDKDGPFASGGKTSILNPHITPLCVNDPYMDQWSNPLLMRGIPKSQEDLRERALSRSTCPTYSGETIQKPFYLSVSGNKNSVLPNTLFDTIADAEESGGVTRRHLSNTSRYGLSERCDDRTFGGELPAPPMKTSTLKPSKRTFRAQTLMAKKMSSTIPITRANATMPSPSTQKGKKKLNYYDDEHSSDEDI